MGLELCCHRRGPANFDCRTAPRPIAASRAATWPSWVHATSRSAAQRSSAGLAEHLSLSLSGLLQRVSTKATEVAPDDGNCVETSPGRSPAPSLGRDPCMGGFGNTGKSSKRLSQPSPNSGMVPLTWPEQTAASSACARSAIRSRTSSIPTERRTRSAARVLFSSGIEAWLMVHGISQRLFTLPKETVVLKMRHASQKRRLISVEPVVRLIIEPWPRA
mmetsp:Transcript_39389/g.86038  ORF Transcript_39389/g.86038 Transcript_39389/m.86038 type:complete len:218 (-) Transcript_39389:147-800(-)